jgi:metal-sulfur cluster biosynthetic enzyme
MTDHSDLPDVDLSGGTATATVDDVTEAMKDVVDPELGINVVDLGLVYGVHVDEDSNAVIDMTLTSAACPLTDVITGRCPAPAIRHSGVEFPLEVRPCGTAVATWR